MFLWSTDKETSFVQKLLKGWKCREGINLFNASEKHIGIPYTYPYICICVDINIWTHIFIYIHMGDASFASILHLCQTTSLSIFWQILILCVCVGGGGYSGCASPTLSNAYGSLSSQIQYHGHTEMLIFLQHVLKKHAKKPINFQNSSLCLVLQFCVSKQHSDIKTALRFIA